MNFKEDDMVKILVRIMGDVAGRWYKVKFIDNNGTFVGKLARKELHDEMPINTIATLNCGDVVQVHKGGEWCYKSRTKVCNCNRGLCPDSY